MTSIEKDRVAIFIYGYGLGNSPSLINAGKILADAGFEVDYFTQHTFIGDLKFNNSRITVYDFDKDGKIAISRYTNFVKDFLSPSVRMLLGQMFQQLNEFKIKSIGSLLYRNNMNAFEDAILTGIRQYIYKTEEIIKDKRYKWFIGVEPEGLIAAGMVGQKQGVPVIYYNLELRLSYESQAIMQKVIKKYEKMFNKFSVFTIIQDEERARLLAKDNEICLQNILTVPVSADGPIYEQKTACLRERFNLTENDRIILYAGFISNWACCEELAKSAASWPKNRILIIHSHGYYDPAYLKKVRKYEGENVKLSMDPVSYDALPSFLASADIGIALYKDLGENFTMIGSASGKLAHYLKSGLPVIANDYPSVRRIIDTFECGVCIDSPHEIIDAMAKIFDKYEIMRRNAFICYEENYMFSRNFTKVIERMGQFDFNSKKVGALL